MGLPSHATLSKLRYARSEGLRPLQDCQQSTNTSQLLPAASTSSSVPGRVLSCPFAAGAAHRMHAGRGQAASPARAGADCTPARPHHPGSTRAFTGAPQSLHQPESRVAVCRQPLSTISYGATQQDECLDPVVLCASAAKLTTLAGQRCLQMDLCGRKYMAAALRLCCVVQESTEEGGEEQAARAQQALQPEGGLTQHVLCKAYFDERAAQCVLLTTTAAVPA